ncbi:hypothetical protein C8R45DRAFT_185931 [Mycena sanguinolenta]|nr:hypothetical protein C8R45DRAFT_185931 [Mycena sanguinolenta]
MFISKSLLACASLLMVLAAQASAYTPNERDNGIESVEIARRATIAQLAAKQTSKKTVFEACTGDDQCQQGCCGFKTGKCAGPDVAQTNGSGGCGRGSKVPNCNVATLLGFKNCIAGAKNNNLKDAPIQQSAAFAAQLDGLPFTPAKRDIDEELTLARRASISQLAAKQKSKKVVTESCTGDDQCQQGCCGFKSGKCAGPDVAQTNGSGGCGRGSKAPNCNVATLLGFKNCIAGAKNNNLKDAAIQQSAAFASQLDHIPFKPSKRDIDEELTLARRASISQLAAKQKSKKFVTESCTGDDQCQQGCCGFKSGKCAGPDVAQTNGSGGCGRGSKAPNCNVATLLGFKNCIAGAKNNNLKDAAIQQSAAFASQLDNIPFKPSKRYIDEEMTISRREGKFAPALLKARVADLELEAREYDELD